MVKQKPEIEEFDNLSISDLMNANSKQLIIAIYMKIKQVNGKVCFHDKVVWAFISILITGFVGGLITYIVLKMIGAL